MVINSKKRQPHKEEGIPATEWIPAEIFLIWTFLKALANEDTLLRTYCCPWCFLGYANWETFVADTKCFWTKSETFLFPGHKICVRNKCCARGQTGKHLCRQQYVLLCQGLKKCGPHCLQSVLQIRGQQCFYLTRQTTNKNIWIIEIVSCKQAV